MSYSQERMRQATPQVLVPLLYPELLSTQAFTNRKLSIDAPPPPVLLIWRNLIPVNSAARLSSHLPVLCTNASHTFGKATFYVPREFGCMFDWIPILDDTCGGS